MQQALYIIDSIIIQFDKNDDIKNDININESLLQFVNECITPNRYDSILCDVGGILNLQNARSVTGKMTGSIYNELFKSKKDEILKLDKKDKEELKQYITSQIEIFMIPKIELIDSNIKKSKWMNKAWSRYKSIENNSKPLIEALEQYGITGHDTKWAITEKVHGANFAIMYNGKEFGAAKFC